MNQDKFDRLARKTLSALPFDFPILKIILNDQSFSFSLRETYERWYDLMGKHNIQASSGFNPFRREIYISRNSPLGVFILEGKKYSDVRSLNFGDAWVVQLLFLMHDYFHIWAYGVMKSILPEKIDFLRKPIDRKNFDDYVFCHLVSEAVATIGLDYWFLSTINLEDKLNLGTNMSTLTVSFHMRNENEFKKLYRLKKPFNTQNVDFFETIAQYYCTGTFYGFDAKDLNGSPTLFSWLRHELSYGEIQREYTRLWFHYLMEGEPLIDAETQLRAPVDIGASWKKKMIRELGKILFAMIKNNVPHYTKTTRFNPRNKSVQKIDLRFSSLSQSEFDQVFESEWHQKNQFNWLMAHGLLSKKMPVNPEGHRKAIDAIVTSKSPLLLKRFLDGEVTANKPGISSSFEIFMLS